MYDLYWNRGCCGGGGGGLRWKSLLSRVFKKGFCVFIICIVEIFKFEGVKLLVFDRFVEK